ncbi:MAG: hydroxymethylbilane synthase [Proteobacteria bacterium]|nr:hydroxymethylbilane synthase [Pseudomonadota bacterium]
MIKPTAIQLVTRGSKLALWQAHMAELAISRTGVLAHVYVKKSLADHQPNTQLKDLAVEQGVKSSFVGTLERELINGHADMAVHSLKDLPTTLPRGLGLVGYLARHSPYDVCLVKKTVRKSIPPVLSHQTVKQFSSLTFATSSLRRQAFLMPHIPQVSFQDIRGNIESRLRKALENKSLDGLILSHASLARLKDDPITSQYLQSFHMSQVDCHLLVPSPGQGVIALEMNVDHQLWPKMTTVSCHLTEFCCSLEREIVGALGGHCLMPIGCYVNAHYYPTPELTILLAIASPSGSHRILWQTKTRVALSQVYDMSKRATLFLALKRDAYQYVLDQKGEKIYMSLNRPFPNKP